MQKRNTFQRQMVLGALQSMHIHATAEEVYEQVAREYQNISLATVYRNLNSLAQEGIIQKIPVPDSADRFDFQAHKHYHLLCKSCGRFEDAPVGYIEELQVRAARESGYQIDSYDIVFTGICPGCAQKNKNGA